MKCFDNIIGITRMPTPCTIDDLPEGYNVSTSGLYLDELPGFPLDFKSLNSLASVGQDLPDILKKAPINAVSEFRRELFKQLQTKFKTNIKPFNGQVGAMTHNRILGLTGSYAGVLYKTQPVRNGVMQITKIITSFDSTATLQLHIYKNGLHLRAVEINTTAGTLKENTPTEEIILPMIDEYGRGINYSFIYERNGIQPRDHEVSCNCGEKEREQKKYISAWGIEGNDTALVSQFVQSNYVNGLLLTIEVRCDADDTICQAYYDQQFIQVTIQWSILRKAVELLIVGMLNSRKINWDTMSNREQMQHNAWNLAKKFNNDVQWVAENIDLSGSDCFACNPATEGYYKSGILS